MGLDPRVHLLRKTLFAKKMEESYPKSLRNSSGSCSS
jgi:hypothetical protein